MPEQAYGKGADMYRSFQVRNFRCFDHLEMTDLTRVNLVAGRNGVGKTALLEALFLHAGAYNPKLTLNIHGFRGYDAVKFELGRWAETPWGALFPEFDPSQAIEFSSQDDVGVRRASRLRLLRDSDDLARAAVVVQPYVEAVRESPVSYETSAVLELEYEEAQSSHKYFMIVEPEGSRIRPLPPAPPFPAFFMAARTRVPRSEDVERFSKLKLEGHEGVLLGILKVIEPRLKHLEVLAPGGVSMIHGDVGLRRMLPLFDLGEGVVRLTSLVVSMARAKGGVVLVDEIENGLHHSVLSKVWQAVGQAAREFGVQLFCTTHSWEAIVAAHEAFSSREPYELGLFRLDRVRDAVRAISYDQSALGAAIESGLEVR